MEKEMEKEKNIVMMAIQNLKENMSMIKDGKEKEKNIMKMMIQNMKENF